MIGKVIHGVLDGDATYSALIGTDGGSVKVYPAKAPVVGKPYAVYHTISRIEDQNKDERGFITYNMQIDHYSDDYDELMSLDEAAISALNRYEGVINGVTVSSIRVIDAGSGYDVGSETDRVMSEFSIKIQP